MLSSHRLMLALTLITPLVAATAAHADEDRGGAVFVLGNEPGGNLIHAYRRSADGALTAEDNYATGGLGAGTGIDPLGSQGSLLYRDGLLLAVNAGSNDLSVFRVRGAQLELLTRVASGGTEPVSVTAHGDLVYVLNAGGTPNITGFRWSTRGDALNPLPGSTQPLPGGASSAPAEVSFSMDGRQLYVTEKGTQQIDTWHVAWNGLPVAPVSTPSQGNTPFGFGVTGDDELVVSEAASGSISVYEASESGALTALAPPELLGQKATCWLVVSRHGHHVFAANAASSTISSLSLSPSGTLTLISAAAASPANPLDLAFSSEDHFIYVRGGNALVSGYRVERDGSLTPVAAIGGIPTSAQGIAAY